MQPDCTAQQLHFQALGTRKVVGRFDAGRVSSDGGAMLLRELDTRAGIVNRFAAGFTDHRDPSRTEHSVEELLRQRAFGLCLGYEDIVDHDSLRDDALLAAAVGRADVLGEQRRVERDRGHPLAGKSTLNRLELAGTGVATDTRYKKIVARDEDIERFFVDEFIDAHKHEPMDRIVLDIDPTDIQLHGKQEGRFFHGYYGHYCYLPLLVFCGDDLLMARLRKADIDGAAGTVDALQWLVPQLRTKWPKAEIVLRADSGFARENIFVWCENNDVEFVIGLARNSRLAALIDDDLTRVREASEESGKPARSFTEFGYATQKTWSRMRRVVAKAEHIPGKSNPRFVVTTYSPDRFDERTLYEDLYCARGEAENRIREFQQDLFGHRASCSKMRANQIRLWLAGLAYTLMNELRRVGLKGTELERAQAATIRLRLLKVGTLITVSRRRLRLAFSSVFPLQSVFERAFDAIDASWMVPT